MKSVGLWMLKSLYINSMMFAYNLCAVRAITSPLTTPSMTRTAQIVVLCIVIMQQQPKSAFSVGATLFLRFVSLMVSCYV